MYAIANMVELGLGEGEHFTSEDHRKVAVMLTICNPFINTHGQLREVVGIINKIPMDELTDLTLAKARQRGIPYI